MLAKALGNLTWFLTHVVFRDAPEVSRLLAKDAPAIAQELVQYDYSRLQVLRIEESAVPPDAAGSALRLVTDLVAFPRSPSDRNADNTLLIYSVQANPCAPLRLVTAFPIKPTTLSALKEAVAA